MLIDCTSWEQKSTVIRTAWNGNAANGAHQPKCSCVTVKNAWLRTVILQFAIQSISKNISKILMETELRILHLFLSIGFVRIFYVVDCIAKLNFYRMNFGDSHSRILLCKKQVKIATQSRVKIVNNRQKQIPILARPLAKDMIGVCIIFRRIHIRLVFAELSPIVPDRAISAVNIHAATAQHRWW